MVRHLAAAVLLSALTGAAMAQSAPDQPMSPSQPTSPGGSSTPPSTSPSNAPAPTPAAQADDGKAMVRLAFSRADANKDGKLTPDEANVLPAVAAKFAQLDTDKDGVISEDEFTAGVRIGN